MNSSQRAQWFSAKADMSFREATDERSPAEVHAAVEAAIASRFPRHTPARLIANGTMNSVWGFGTDHRRLAVKLPRVPDGDLDGVSSESYRVEAIALQQALAGGVDAPRVAALDRSRAVVPFDFLITDREDGPSLRALDEDEDEDAILACYPAVATALRKTHSIQVTGVGLCLPDEDGELRGSMSHWGEYLGTRLNEHLGVLVGAGIVAVSESSDIRDMLDPLRALTDRPTRLLHGDCGPHNMIRRIDGSVALIDWEDATGGDPLFELAQWATFNPRRRWSTMLDLYTGGTWLPDHLFWLYFLRITVAKLVVRARFRLPDLPGRPTARDRIEQALAELRVG